MKKIIIEISEEQFKIMETHKKRGAKINEQSDSHLSGCSLKLCCTPIGDWLEIESNGKLNLGEVNWNIEEVR